jgi:PAS domain S-box-containing protein
MTALPTDKIISCFYDSSEDCIKVVDPSGMLLSFNPNGLKAMEIDDPKDVLGKEWLDFWKGDLRQLAAEALIKATNGELAKFEGYCPTFKGTIRYWEVTIAPLFNDFREVQWLLVNSRDATRRIEMEAELVVLREQVKKLQST